MIRFLLSRSGFSTFYRTIQVIYSPQTKKRRISPMTMKAEFNYWGNYYTVVLPDGSSLRCDNNDEDRRELENELLEEGYYVRW